MTDHPTVGRPGGAPEDGADARDERVAARLAVPPLDDHTRARLIRRALEEVPGSTTGRSRRAWALVAAAALLVVAVASGLLLASGGGRSPSAQRAPHRPPTAGSQVPAAAPGAAATVAPRDLGGVGDVTDPARLRRVLAGPAGAASGSLTTLRDACGNGEAVAGVTRVEAVGTGVDAGQPAAIVVGRDTAGRRVAVVVALHGCRVLQRIPLG
jgi:hypothetical protein